MIFVVETIIAGSLFSYKDSFTEGLKGGLNQSIRNYGPDYVMKSADFDAMQEHVSVMRNINKHQTITKQTTNRHKKSIFT